MPMYRAFAPFSEGDKGDRRVTGFTSPKNSWMNFAFRLLHCGGGGWFVSTFVVSCDSHHVSSNNQACLHLNSRENWGVKYIFAFGKWHSNCSILSRIYLQLGLLPLLSLSPFCHPCHPYKRMQTPCTSAFCHPVTLFEIIPYIWNGLLLVKKTTCCVFQRLSIASFLQYIWPLSN